MKAHTGRRAWTLAATVLSLLAAGCGTSLDVNRYEPGVYKGTKDPLLAAHNTPEQAARLQKRFTLGQADR